MSFLLAVAEVVHVNVQPGQNFPFTTSLRATPTICSTWSRYALRSWLSSPSPTTYPRAV